MAAPVAEVQPDTFSTRVLSALVLAPVALGLVWLGGWYFTGLIVVAGVLMVPEWDRLCQGPGRGFHVLVLSAALIGVGMSVKFGQWQIAAGVALTGVVLYMLLSDSSRRSWSVLGAVYILIPMGALLWIRLDPQWGLLTVVWMLLTVWATDTGAYFAGKSIGGPKMAPRFSPNKTWAGLFGGIIAAVVSSMVLGQIAGAGTPALLGLFGALAAVAGQVGDVFESAIKRHFGVKDSGTIIPGHGGLFDRLDSLLFVATIVAAGNLLTGKVVIWQ